MRYLSRCLAAVLTFSIAFQPTLARATMVRAVVPSAGVNVSMQSAVGGALSHIGISNTAQAGSLALPGASLTGSQALLLPNSPIPTLAAPAAAGRNALSKPGAARAPSAGILLERAYQGATLAPRALGKRAAQVQRRIGSISSKVQEGTESMSRTGNEGAYGISRGQIGLLTGMRTRDASSLPVSAQGTSMARLFGPKPHPKANLAAPDKAKAPDAEKKTSRIGDFFKGNVVVFKDQERNKSFWRYFLGEQIYLFGFQMYIVALPYLMKSFTSNTLKEDGRLEGTTREALQELVRQNRSLARIAHWVSQAAAYIAVPLFTKGDEGPRRWLVRTALLRGLVLAGIPGIFFASGMVSGSTALWILLGLIGAQSFFQGIYVTMSSGSIARIMGDKTVTAEERTKANSIRTFASAIVAIIAPAIAGKISGIGELFGKMGAGSAVIYGIYAASVAVAGLVFATIRMLAEKRTASPEVAGQSADPDAAAAPKGLGGILKNVGISMKEGIKLVWKNRFLRVMMLMSLIMSLFSDPLVFNVLPEYVSTVLQSSPGAIDFLMNVPLIGWWLDGLMATPAGFFALLMTFSSIGSALAMLMAKPLTKLFKKFGFKTEESLTIPFYALAFLKVPAFWAMIYFPSFWTVLLLYGLQTLSVSFVGLTMTGIYQKQLGKYSSKQMNQVLAAQSFVGIIMAIAATYVYGFVLGDIAIKTSLMIAGAAITLLGLIRLAAPWLLFTKAQRKWGTKNSPPKGSAGEAGSAIEEHEAPESEGKPQGNGPLSVRL